MSPEFVYQLLTGFLVAGGIYGGIRVDLKAMHQRIAKAEEVAEKAHERLSEHVERHHVKG